VGTSKILARYKGSTISLQAAVHLGHRPRALMTKKKKKVLRLRRFGLAVLWKEVEGG
jgi:hypothetical protein